MKRYTGIKKRQRKDIEKHQKELKDVKIHLYDLRTLLTLGLRDLQIGGIVMRLKELKKGLLKEQHKGLERVL